MLTQHNRKTARLSPDYTWRYMSWECGLGTRLASPVPMQIDFVCAKVTAGSELRAESSLQGATEDMVGR